MVYGGRKETEGSLAAYFPWCSCWTKLINKVKSKDENFDYRERKLTLKIVLQKITQTFSNTYASIIPSILGTIYSSTIC